MTTWLVGNSSSNVVGEVMIWHVSEEGIRLIRSNYSQTIISYLLCIFAELMCSVGIHLCVVRHLAPGTVYIYVYEDMCAGFSEILWKTMRMAETS